MDRNAERLGMAERPITVAICEDEPYFLKQLGKNVQHFLDVEGYGSRILTFSSGEALLAASQTFDILLADIRLPGKSGLEVARQLCSGRQDSQLIFITAYPEYAAEAFELDAIHYIVKPVSEEKLSHALKKALRHMPRTDCRRVTVAKGARTDRIPIRDILYCESLDHRIFVHTQMEEYAYFGTLEKLEKQLDGRFFRCHKSYLVNLDYVVSRQQDSVTVTNGDRVLLARRKRQEFSRRLLDYFREEVL